MKRESGRAFDALRQVDLTAGVSRHAEGSCLSCFGHTRVLCTASFEHGAPRWLKNSGSGWVTAEYAMLPRATHTRGRREVTVGRASGRTLEIQRLIGRSLRAVIDPAALGENQIVVDCDVLQADGGTRTAALTGAWVALAQACRHLRKQRIIERDPIRSQAAAVSVVLCDGQGMIDPDYQEDSRATVDTNFVMASGGDFIEIQCTGEQRPFSRAEFNSMAELAQSGCAELLARQRECMDSDA